MSSDRSSQPAAGIEELLAGTAYEPVKRLGAGAMGEVYQVRARSFGGCFALKVLRPFFALAPQFVERMRQEAQVLGRLDHPHVVEVVDFWIGRDSRPCILMELLEGRTLAEELLDRGRIPPDEAVEIIRHALDALMTAHANGIVHRDLKPENLFLHQQPGLGRVLKVLDFGVVRLLDGGDGVARTQTGAIVGSPRFISSEQASGVWVDHRTDIYAMGMVLYVMLAGRGPFDGGARKAPPPSRYAPAVTPALDAIVLRAIRPLKEERYQSANELLRDLRAIMPPAGQPSLR